MRAKKYMKRLLSALVICGLIGQSVVGIPANAAETKRTEPDMTLTSELSQSSAVISQFLLPKAKINQQSSLLTLSDNYIPTGANCTDVSVIGDAVYIDYQLNNIRYLVAYYKDGTVEKVAREIGDNEVYSIDSINNVVENVNAEERLQIIELTDTEAMERMNELKNSHLTNENSSILENGLTRASGKIVYPVSYKNAEGVEPYKARVVQQDNVIISAFSGTSYSTSQPYCIYETMSYHTEVTRKTQAFAIGATLTKIASLFIVQVSTAKAWLTAAGVILNASNILQEACQVVEESAYTYLGGKECGNYDPTQYHTYVETYSTWSQGRITMVWQYGANGYRNPTWGHSARSASLQVSNDTVRDNGKSNYNQAIANFGVWKNGVGNGFGY